jgi:hypothetical protein
VLPHRVWEETVVRIPAAVRPALVLLALTGRALAQSGDPIELRLSTGTPLRIALDRSVTIHQAGQPVTGIVLEPVYAYDRVVLPAGTRAIGHIARLEHAHGATRAQQIATGDFTPPPVVFVQFDRLEPPAGPPREIRTTPAIGIETLTVTAAPPSKDNESLAARARDEAVHEARHALQLVTAPGKIERLKNAAIGSLPYHPNSLRARTVYVAPLETPLTFDTVPGPPRAGADTLPPPDAVLLARIVTAVDSRSPKGTALEAVLTRPVLTGDGQLLLPEGTSLTGTVTFSRAARRFHHDGQLRFLIDHIAVPGSAPIAALASLHAVQASGSADLSVDEEGGVSANSSLTRFVAPALAAAALMGSMRDHVETDSDSTVPEVRQGSGGSATVGGFIGFSGLGVVLAHVAHPVAVGITIAGLARTTYRAVVGRGQDVSFPEGTPIQLRLAPRHPSAP